MNSYAHLFSLGSARAFPAAIYTRVQKSTRQHLGSLSHRAWIIIVPNYCPCCVMQVVDDFAVSFWSAARPSVLYGPSRYLPHPNTGNNPSLRSLVR